MKLDWRQRLILNKLKDEHCGDSQNKKLNEILSGLLDEDNDENQKGAAEKLKNLILSKNNHCSETLLNIAQGLFGICLLFGLGVEKNIIEAANLLRIAKKNKIPFALYYLGWMLQHGVNVNKIIDLEKAKKIYHFTAFELNDALSAIELATLIIKDKKVTEEEYQQAILLYKKARKENIPEANLGLGWLYQYCLGGPHNLLKAIKYYRLAADAGNARALFNLGVLYGAGEGVEQDIKQSCEYFKLACEQGLPEAQYNLGAICFDENGPNYNPRLGFKLTKKSAKQGLLLAKYKLGLLYKLGVGIEANFCKARQWFKEAADEGDIEAIKELVQLNFNEENKKIHEIISMAPINSSGDIYHILSFIIRQRSDKQPIPDIVLCYDTDNQLTGSKTDTKEQVERSFLFAEALDLHHYFKNPFLDRILSRYFNNYELMGATKKTTPQEIIKQYLGSLEACTLHLQKGKSSQPNPRQIKLENFFQNEAQQGCEVHYTDQRAMTTTLCDSFRRDRQKMTLILAEGFKQRNSKVLSETAQKILKEYAEYWKSKIIDSRKKDQPLIIIHLRHSAAANSKQDAADNLINHVCDYLKKQGYLVWFIFADSRLKGSFTGIKNNRISPFSEPLKKDKAHYEKLMDFESRLAAESAEFDFGKLKHLELLIALRTLDFLKGIIGNTSGTLDVAAFIGHFVYNIHHFSEKLSYQDYRMLLGLSFLSIESDAGNYSEDNLLKKLPNFEKWLRTKKRDLVPPTIDFEEPDFEKAGINTLFYYKVFKQNSEPKLLPLPEGHQVQKFVKRWF